MKTNNQTIKEQDIKETKNKAVERLLPEL